MATEGYKNLLSLNIKAHLSMMNLNSFVVIFFPSAEGASSGRSCSKSKRANTAIIIVKGNILDLVSFMTLNIVSCS